MCPGPVDRLGSFSLCRPSFYNSFAVVGTDDSEDGDHYLMWIDIKRMSEDLRADPIVDLFRVSEVRSLKSRCPADVFALPLQHIRQVRWLGNTKIIAAQGEGTLALYDVSRDDRKLKHHGGRWLNRCPLIASCGRFQHLNPRQGGP